MRRPLFIAHGTFLDHVGRRDGTPRFFQPRGGVRVFVQIPVVHCVAQQLEKLNVSVPGVVQSPRLSQIRS
jgi:hypothetical protein